MVGTISPVASSPAHTVGGNRVTALRRDTERLFVAEFCRTEAPGQRVAEMSSVSAEWSEQSRLSVQVRPEYADAERMDTQSGTPDVATARRKPDACSADSAFCSAMMSVALVQIGSLT